MKKAAFLFIIACSLIISFNSVSSSQVKDYHIKSGDVLNIQVYRNPDLSTPYNSYVVRPDGLFSVPLIGDINTRNKTVLELSREISDKLSVYLVNPIVTVNVVKEGYTRTYLFGEIKNQGLYEFSKSHNLLDVISSAGGFTKLSAKKRVFVVRNNEKISVTEVNVNDVLKGKNKDNIFQLKDGDCIYFSSNHMIELEEDILPFIQGALLTSEIDNMD